MSSVFPSNSAKASLVGLRVGAFPRSSAILSFSQMLAKCDVLFMKAYCGLWTSAMLLQSRLVVPGMAKPDSKQLQHPSTASNGPYDSFRTHVRNYRRLWFCLFAKFPSWGLSQKSIHKQPFLPCCGDRVKVSPSGPAEANNTPVECHALHQPCGHGRPRMGHTPQLTFRLPEVH